MKQRYLMGEVCKLFNTTRDTLRHYESIGLVNPKKDKNNGYRYYEVEDLNSLTDIFFLKKLNLSLSDIHKAVKNSTPKDILDIINDKEKCLEEEIDKIKNLQKTLHSMKINVQSCINNLNKLDVREEKEDLLFVEITKENEFKDFIDIIEGMVEIVEDIDISNKNFLEYVNFTFLIEDESILTKDIEDKIKWGVSFKQKHKSLEQIMLHEKVKSIPKNKFIYTVIAINDKEYDDWLEVIKDIIIKNNIEVAGSILGRMLLTEYNNDMAVDYYEVHIPIK